MRRPGWVVVSLGIPRSWASAPFLALSATGVTGGPEGPGTVPGGQRRPAQTSLGLSVTARAAVNTGPVAEREVFSRWGFLGPGSVAEAGGEWARLGAWAHPPCRLPTGAQEGLPADVARLPQAPGRGGGGTPGLGSSRRGGPHRPDCCFRQLPLRICKKVLVIMHDSILPHLAQPSLMIDFLARACDVGEQGAPGGPGAGSSGTRAAVGRGALQPRARQPAGVCRRVGLHGCVSVCRWSRQPPGFERTFHPDS